MRPIGSLELIPPATAGRRVWLRVGTLLDGTGTMPTRPGQVVYDQHRMLFVGDGPPPAELVNPGQRQPDVDLPDYTLLPGLIEAHAHLFLEGGELDPDKRAAYLRQTPEALLQGALPRLDKLVRLGVIAIRDAGDKDGVGLALSRLYRSRRGPEADSSGEHGGDPRFRPSAAAMPYVDSPGAAIHHRGRYGSFMAYALEHHPSLRACVESRVKAGADRIKLIPTGIINFKMGAVTTEPQMSAEEVAELVNAAKSFGKQTFAHASGDAGIERAIAGGVDSVEHGFFIREDQLARMRDQQMGWVPTFAPVQAQLDHADQFGWDAVMVSNLKRILDQHAVSLQRAHAMGVRIIAGSDAGSCGVAHGLGFLYELELMERAGLAPIAVINSATGAAASRLDFPEDFGRIKPGFLSRFLLTRHSPLERVSNLRRDKVVVFDGQVFASREHDRQTGP